MTISGIADDKIFGTRGDQIVRVSLPDCKLIERVQESSMITGVSNKWYATHYGSFIGPDIDHSSAYSGGTCDIIDIGHDAIILDVDYLNCFIAGKSVRPVDSLWGEHDRLHKGRSSIFVQSEGFINRLHLESSGLMWEVMLANSDTFDAVVFLSDNLVLFTTYSSLLCVADMRCKAVRTLQLGTRVSKIYTSDDRIVIHEAGPIGEFSLLI